MPSTGPPSGLPTEPTAALPPAQGHVLMGGGMHLLCLSFPHGVMGFLPLFLASDFTGSVKGFHFSVSYLFRTWRIIVQGVGVNWSTQKSHALLSERWDCVSGPGSLAETRAGEAEACGVRGDCRQPGLWPGAFPTLSLISGGPFWSLLYFIVLGGVFGGGGR